MTITDRMAAWWRERRVLARVSRAAWRFEQAERERSWALVSARAEGVSIRTVAAAAGLSAARVHQIMAGAELDELDAAPGELRAKAARGLVLLRLMAEAADPDRERARGSMHWVNRRVEQLEFLDQRAVRWRVSVDFVLPDIAPVTSVGDQDFKLVPLTSWEKDNLVAFDLRDEAGNAIWLPTSAETECLLSSALIFWAKDILKWPDKDKRTPKLETTLKAIVSEWPSPWQKEQWKEERRKQWKEERQTPRADEKPEDLFKVVRDEMITKYGDGVAEDYLCKTPPELQLNESFWSQVNELWRNFLIIVPVKDKPRTRHVFKMTFESQVEFRKPGSWLLRIAQSMGWREWRLELFIGGRGGSHHLEVAAPPGVDLIRIRARPRAKIADPAIRPASRYVVSYGGAPQVHIRIPAQRLRYLATTRVRVSRPGWLTMCWLAGLVIAGALLASAVQLRVLFLNAAEAGTGATLLLALLAVFATVLASPGAHPLASRLLWGPRVLILIDLALVLWAAGLLLLHNPSTHHDPARQWWVIFVISALCTVPLTLAWLFPRGPRRTMIVDGAGQEEAPPGKPPEPVEPDPASLAIPAADGYHYGDDHEWGECQQGDLVVKLRETESAVSGLGPQWNGHGR